MASSEHPDTPPATNETPAPTGIQTPASLPAPAEPSSITLPPLPPPVMDETKFLRLCGRLDAVLVGVVLLFAFLVASFPVANPDFFRQLATGRLLMQGEYHFGVDPFVYSAGDTYWVNHSWLFALLMYGLYQLPAIGGAAVVIFKAILIAALAAILIRAGRRPGQSLWIPAAGTALAILAASPRFYLQPAFLSLLFLGVTFGLLIAGEAGNKRFWWLLPLFVLWVNCDAWFFLGPLTVAFYLVGELLQQRLSANAGEMEMIGTRPDELRTLGLVFAISLAACLVNPHHIHAWTLPPEFGLTAAGDLLEDDPQFHTFYLSPLRNDYYQPYFGLSVAGLAYWPLLLLSLASFAFVTGRLPWPRLLVWLGFALLSFYNARAIPFFAIVAGPIMALNALDYAARRFAPGQPLTRGWRNGALGGRMLTVLAGLALLIATVPGWLQNQPRTRRLGWSVRVDPSLQALAQTIHAWRQAGRFDRLGGEPHWFNLYYEVADYLAWFAPGERVFVDPNLLYFHEAAEDYRAIRLGLEEMVRAPADAEGDAIAGKAKWQKILRKWKVHYWIFDDLRLPKSDPIADHLLFSYRLEKEWVLCHLNGRMAIFAWRDPQQPEPDPSEGLALDYLERLAFGPNAEPAPSQGAEPRPPSSWWETAWETWWPASVPLSTDRETVGLYDFYYQVAERPRQIASRTHAWQAAVAAAVLADALPCGPVPNNLLALSWSYTYRDLLPPGMAQPIRQPGPAEQAALIARNMYVDSQFIEPPSLYLSVRAARRVLEANPDDGITYFRLGQTYQRLRELPQEQSLQRLGSRLADLRRVQTVTALQNALRLPLDDERAAQAHEILFRVYLQLRYPDAAVHHLREALNKRTALGPPPGMSATQYNQRLDQISAQLTRMDSELERLQNRYEVTAASKSGLEKVNAALELGLAETALAVLEQSADTNVGTQAEMAIVKKATVATLELGRLDRARDLLPDMDKSSIQPEDLDLYLRLAAARGDYGKADRLLVDALQRPAQPVSGPLASLATIDRTGMLIGRALLGEGQRLLGTPSLPCLIENPSDFWIRRWRLGAIVNGLDIGQRQAELHLLRGWFALESGHCVEANRHFETVRALIVPQERWVPEINRLNAWFNPQREISDIQRLSFRHIFLDNLSQNYQNWLVEDHKRP